MFKCILARNCEGTEQLQNNTEKTEYSGERGKYMSYAIAIDGPSGAGKSTIAKRVAKELSFIYVDTGAMYRAMALYVLEQNIDPQDQAKVAAVCPDIDVTILYEDGVQQVLLNGKNVSAEIRQEIVGNTASRISVIKEVREKLVALQRQLAAIENVVMDGRDIGTQVLPDATVKIYLTASAKERAKRRHLELKEKGMPGELDQIEADIIERDNRDMNREISPLRQAEDAVLVDASFMGIEEVTAAVIAEFEKKKQAEGEHMEERKILVARTAGFCFGVKRAVEKVYEQVNMGKQNIYTYGPIIHNEEVVTDLGKKGVRVLENEQELKNLMEGTVVIRSHGVPKEIYEVIEEKGLECVDATCPFVRKIHKIVERESKAGRHIIIVGNDTHPEVEGIKGWCEGPVTVISSHEEAENLAFPEGEKLCVVSQTTFNYNKFQELVEIFEKKRYDKVVLNTICSATEERQMEARQIACEADTMIVIGGRHSSNTQKLYEICRKECENTYYIQTLVDLDTKPFQCIGCVGITAGASTPNNIIEEVQKHVRIKF